MYDTPQQDRPGSRRPPFLRLADAQEQLDLAAATLHAGGTLTPPGPIPRWFATYFTVAGLRWRYRLRRRVLTFGAAADLLAAGRDIIRHTGSRIDDDDLAELERIVAKLSQQAIPAFKATAYPAAAPAARSVEEERPEAEPVKIDVLPPTLIDGEIRSPQPKEDLR